MSLGIFLLPPSERLTRSNHLLWKAQVLFALKGAQLAGFIKPDANLPSTHLPPKPDAKDDDPLVANPEFAIWEANDQTVLSYLLSNLGRDILV